MADSIATSLILAWASFFTHMKTLKGVAMPQGGLPIRSVSEGEILPSQYPNPHLNIQLLSYKVTERTGDAKIWKGDIKIRVYCIVPGVDTATAELIEKIAAINDKIDAYPRLDGMQGFEDGEWGLTYPVDVKSGGIVVAERLTSFHINVAKGAN